MIVDANVLIYAVDARSRFHVPMCRWLEDSLNGPTRVGLPWMSLIAFQRIITHPRASDRPLDPESAWAHIDDWLAAPSAWVPTPTDRHSEVLRDLVTDGDLRGNLVSDAHLAALAIEYGVGVCSADSDFARFPAVAWTNPAARS